LFYIECQVCMDAHDLYCNTLKVEIMNVNDDTYVAIIEKLV